MLGRDAAGIVALKVIQNQFRAGRQPSDILGAAGCKCGAESVRRERDAGHRCHRVVDRARVNMRPVRLLALLSGPRHRHQPRLVATAGTGCRPRRRSGQIPPLPEPISRPSVTAITARKPAIRPGARRHATITTPSGREFRGVSRLPRVARDGTIASIIRIPTCRSTAVALLHIDLETFDGAHRCFERSARRR
jgi:hypothetical protein